ncbi:MAG: PAS domain S-box protein [Ktedonobacteraceae bacterium]|nr:PAS domain S-box protein [Ktedonobacteraceae bacterium]
MLLIEMAHDAIIVCDEQRRILSWNRAAQQIYGWSAAEAVGKHVHVLLSTRFVAKQAGEAQKEIEYALEREGQWQGEIVQNGRDGRQVVVACRMALVREDERRPFTLLLVGKDITARKQSEAQLAEQSRLLAAAGRIGFWSWNIAQDRIALSQQFSDVFSASPGEAISYERFLDHVHPDDRQQLWQAVTQAIEERNDYIGEFRLLRPHADALWVFTYGHCLYDEQGQPTDLVGVVMNIDRQKRLEEELIASRARITYILESIGDYFLFLDSEWRYLYVNAPACKAMGKTRDELLGRSIWEVFPELLGSDLEYHCRQAMATQQSRAFETFLQSPGRWLAVHLYPTGDGLSIYGVDITEHKLVEQALRASEAKFRRLVEANINPIMVCDGRGRVWEANDAFLELVGYSREELDAGQVNWRRLTPPEYRQQDRAAIREKLATGVCRPYEKECVHKSGRRVPIQIAGALLEDRHDRAICFIIDLMKQKELEKQREQLLSVVSHELRTPLTGIRGNAQLAQRRFRHLLKESTLPSHLESRRQSIETTLDNALRQVDVLDRLIGDLVESTRIAEGRFSLAMRSCDLLAVVRETVASMQSSMPERTVLLEDEPAEPMPVQADPDRITQVLMNYLSNALKYSPAHQPVEVGLTPSKHEVKVWVRDHGVGLTPEQQQRVWERFYRVPGIQHSTRHGVNLGLGLYVCQALISLHHGHVGVESQPGKGSTFWFTLPR